MDHVQKRMKTPLLQEMLQVLEQLLQELLQVHPLLEPSIRFGLVRHLLVGVSPIALHFQTLLQIQKVLKKIGLSLALQRIQ